MMVVMGVSLWVPSEFCTLESACFYGVNCAPDALWMKTRGAWTGSRRARWGLFTLLARDVTTVEGIGAH